MGVEKMNIENIEEKIEKSTYYLLKNKSVLVEHCKKEYEAFKETKDIDGILPPAKKFRLKVLESWAGVPITEEDFDKIDQKLAREFRTEIFEIHQNIRKDEMKESRNKPLPEEPEYLTKQDREVELIKKQRPFKGRGKEYFPDGEAGIEKSLPKGDK